jgi:hypothetical protein
VNNSRQTSHLIVHDTWVETHGRIHQADADPAVSTVEEPMVAFRETRDPTRE